MSLIQNANGYALAFHANDVTTNAMRSAITEWFDLYYHDAPTKTHDPCQRIPYTIVRKLSKTVFSEHTATSADAFATGILRELTDKRDEALQLALIGGECLLKPVPVADGFRFVTIPRNNMLVFARGADGRITDLGTAETTTFGNYYYTLLERRTVDENGYLTIRNSLYRSMNKDDLGQAAPLNSLPQYADLPQEYTFTEKIGSVGLVSLRTPMVNCVDGSADAVSVYAAAAGLIRSLDRKEAQLNGEFDRGESRIIVSADLLKKDAKGERSFSDHIFVGLDEDPETVGVTTFSPQLREQSFLTVKQEILRNIENVIGLKRGLLSEVEAAERTATEITSSAGEYNLTIIELQDAWEKVIRETMRLCSTLGKLYHVAGAHDVADDEVVINWGNGVLYDESKTWADYKDMTASGLLKPEIAVGWRFNMPTETEEDLATVRTKYMPGVETLLADVPPETEKLQKTGETQPQSEAVKTLNGAQTQSLLSVIAQYQAGALSIGQAINVLSIAISVSKEKAKAIIEGALE